MNSGRSKKLEDLIAYLDAGAHQLARDNAALRSFESRVSKMPTLALDPPSATPPVERILRVLDEGE